AGVTSSSMGFATLLALDEQGGAWGIGWNATGQIGDGALDGMSCPGGGTSVCVGHATPVPGLTGLARIVAGSQGSAAITRDGRVLVWGSNFAGEQAHPPNAMGDASCGPSIFCNPQPSQMLGLP